MCEVSETVKNVVSSLKDNPVFRMSLASKELFHSNMLAWLLESQNIDGLADIFAPCDDKGNKLKDFKVLTVLREKSHFDLIIVFLPKDDYDSINNEDLLEIKDLFLNYRQPSNIELLKQLQNDFRFAVVENKFKSIPNKEQLEKYDGKNEICFIAVKEPQENRKRRKTLFPIVLKGENTSRYLMAPKLALDNFEKHQECQKWLPLPYEKILNVLQSKIDDTAEDFTAQFIKCYVDFLDNMLQLTTDIEEKLKPTDNPAFPNPEDIRELKKIRIHDFYEKLWFSVLLNRIEITNEDKIKKGSGYTNALGLLDFKFIGCSDLVWYGIQIQNKQLRIVVEPKWGNKWQGEYPKKQINKYCDDILNLMNEQLLNEQQPYTAFEFKNTKDLCSFGDFKYKYIPLYSDISIKNLESMINKAWTAIRNSTLKNLTLSQQNDNENIQ